jgi:hypothetical protein
MMDVWMLSKFYDCEVHGWAWPVCAAYGDAPRVNRHAEDPDGWALVKVWTSPQQIEAAKQDPRVIVCGKDFNAPPRELLEAYASWLDPTVTYMFMGQVIAKLAEAEPIFHSDV